MPKVTEMYAWIFDDPEEKDGEHIGGMMLPDGACPMVTAQRENADLMRGCAMALRQRTGRSGRLVKFTTRTVLEELAP